MKKRKVWERWICWVYEIYEIKETAPHIPHAVKICKNLLFFGMLKSSHLCSRYSFYVVFGIVIVVAFITIIFVFRLFEVIHLFNSRSVQRIFICCIIYSFISCLIWISLLQSCVPQLLLLPFFLFIKFWTVKYYTNDY